MKNRTALVIAIVVVFAVAAIWMNGAVLAQRGGGAQGRPGGPAGPGAPGGMQPPPAPCIGMLRAGATGVYVLAGPTLIKYNAALEEQGKLTLVEAPATTDAAPRPPLHGALLIAPATQTVPEKVLVVIGDRFFAVDGATFQVTATGNLPAIEPPADETAAADARKPQRPMGPPPGPGALEYHDGTLYVQRGPAIIAITIADGSILGQATLPKPAAQ